MSNKLQVIAERVLDAPTSLKAARLMGALLFRLTGRHAGRHGEINLSAVERVLVIRLDEIGDLVMTTSFLRELRRNVPQAWITLVVKPACYNLVESCPYINELLTHDYDMKKLLSLSRQQKRQRHAQALKLARRHLWQRRFDLAILPRWETDFQNATFPSHFSGARYRVGYSEKVTATRSIDNAGLDTLLTHVVTESTERHEVEHNLNMIRYLGGTIEHDHLELWIEEKDEEFAQRVLESNGVHSNELIVALNLGAGEAKRMWPLANFVEIGKWMSQEYDARLVVTGGPAEKRLGEQLQQQLGGAAINLAGQTTLRQTAALLKQCHLYVGNDTGSMHMAAAVGTPVVEISCHPIEGLPWHPNSPRCFGPWGVPHQVLQPKKALEPCFEACSAKQAHCILGVTVDDVKEAISRQLSQQDRQPLLEKEMEHAGY